MDYLEIRELYHHGIKGQKWGYRRYQNEDGTLTEAGKERYGVGANGEMSSTGKRQFKIDQQAIRGQHRFEKGQTVRDLQKSKRRTNLILGTLGALSLSAAFAGTSKDRVISGKEYAIRSGLLGLGIAAGAASITNSVARGKQIKDIRAYYVNGPKQIIQIDGKKKE